MAIKPDLQEKKDYPIISAGTHLARCYQLIHVGHIPNTHPKAVSPIVNKIRLTWEFPTELHTFSADKGEQPFVLSSDFTLSMNEKSNLRKMAESWFGKKFSDEEAAEFDAESLVGKECLVTVTHTEKDGRTYASVQNITSLPKGMNCPEGINKTNIITWENITPDQLGKFPKFLQDTMKQAAEYGPWCAKNDIEQVAF